VRVEADGVLREPDGQGAAPLFRSGAARGRQEACPGNGARGKALEEAAAGRLVSAKHGVSFF
jgi:hypothetical protein